MLHALVFEMGIAFVEYFYLFENSEHRSKKKYFIFIFSKTSELETNAFKKKKSVKG